MADTITTEQEVDYTFSITDGRGRSKPADGIPVAATSDPTVAVVSEATSAGGNDWMVTVSSVAPGTCRISVTADADTAPDIVNEVVGTADVEVTLDPRTGARISSMSAGTPRDKVI